MRTLWTQTAVLACAALVTTTPATALAVPTHPSKSLETPQQRQAEEQLRSDMDRILQDPDLSQARVGVVIRDPATDEILYDRDAAQRRTPASTAKLLTAAGALETLGPDYRFRTQVATNAQVRAGVLEGELFLRGTGDPTMQAADYERLAEQVAASGVREIQGLRTDATWFDKQLHGQGWAEADLPYYYAAPIGALTVAANGDFDAGSVGVRVSPTSAGQPVEVALSPQTGVVTVDNRATTGSGQPLTVQREPHGNRIVVSGSVPAGSEPVEELSSVPDPEAYAGDVFARALQAHGVQVTGKVSSARTPRDARILAQRESMQLSELLVPFMKLSNNGHAEALVKAMGRAERGQGSWKAGLDALGATLENLGLAPEALRLADGSGLSALNQVPPEQLAVLLDNAQQRPWFGAWREALPVAGQPERMVGGTLRNRMAGTAAAGNVRAKTGSLSGVSSLAGYVTTRSGRPLVFSVALNDVQAGAGIETENAIAVRLAEDAGV